MARIDRQLYAGDNTVEIQVTNRCGLQSSRTLLEALPSLNKHRDDIDAAL